MDVKRYVMTSVCRAGATTLYSTKPCLIQTCVAALSNFTANLYYRPPKKLFSVLESGWYEGQIHLETGLITPVHTRWSNKPRKDGGYWAITDRQRDGGGERGIGEGERGGEEEEEERERYFYFTWSSYTFLILFPSLLIFYLLIVILFVFI
jgi:hypothetical protein